MTVTSSFYPSNPQPQRPPSPVLCTPPTPALEPALSDRSSISIPSSISTSTSTVASATATDPSPSRCGQLLPEECLQEIFNNLAKDILTLHSLLFVSKTFFRIAMPLLYAAPFDLLESNSSWTSQERTKRHASLLYLLMSCCSEEDMTEEPHLPLWAGLPPICPEFQAAHESLKRPLVDYLSANHHHLLCLNLLTTFPILFPNIQRYPIPSQNLHPRQQRALNAMGNTTIAMFTRNEIERTLLLHSPGRVKTISLPIQRLGSFLEIGPLLASLVRFELHGITWHFNLDPAVAFFQEHGRLHGTIRDVKMAGPHDVRLLQKPPLHRILKEIRHPRVIDLSRYREAIRDFTSYEIQNPGGIEELLFHIEFVPSLPSPPPLQQQQQPLTAISNIVAGSEIQNLTMAVPQGPIHAQPQLAGNLPVWIRQCTKLTRLHIGVQSPTAFAWAVDYYNVDSSSPLQLHTLHMSSNRTAIIKQALEDCVYAFRDSLEDINGVALKLSPVDPSLPETIQTFGWSWPLNRLTMLSLRGELAVWFDLESLAYCPRLSQLNLTLNPYSPPKADYLYGVALAPQLTGLSLVGRWILTDGVMAKLGEGLQRLKKLQLSGCQCDGNTLTGRGLTDGLDMMTGLKIFDVELGPKMDEVMRTYREARPDLDIHMLSDFDSQLKLLYQPLQK